MLNEMIWCQKYGVPQGCIQEPHLFILYINDIEEVIKSRKFHLFADDMIYISLEVMTSQKLQNDIENIRKWLIRNGLNGLKLNKQKIKIILVCVTKNHNSREILFFRLCNCYKSTKY